MIGVAVGLPFMASRGGGRPSLVLNLMGGAIDSRFTTTGGVGGTCFNSAGNLVSASCPRFDYNPATLAALGLLSEPQSTNSLRNNTMVGAVNGVLGSGGAFPTNWSYFSPGLTGESVTVVGTGTENGISYIDLQFQATAGGGSPAFAFEPNVACSAAQSWSQSAFLRLVGGTLTNISSLVLRTVFYAADGTTVTGTPTSAALTPTGAALSTQRSLSPTVSPATSAFVRPDLIFTAGGAYNFTLRVGLPQLEQSATATSPIKTSGSAVTRTADVVKMSGATLSSIYAQGVGTIFFKGLYWGVKTTGSNFPRMASLYPAASPGTDEISVYVLDTAGATASPSGSVTNASTGVSVSLSAVAKGVAFKAALAFDATTARISSAGVSAALTSPPAPPVVDTLGLAQAVRFQQQPIVHIQEIRLYQPSLPAATINPLTT